MDRSRAHAVRLLLTTLFLLAVPIAAFLGTRWAAPATIERLEVAIEPVAAPVRVARARFPVRADLVLRRPPVEQVVWHGEPGLVTRVHVQSGDLLSPGTILLEREGVPVLALFGESPQWRSLELGDHGPDVLDIARFLDGTTGALLGESDEFTAEVAAAVRELERLIGSDDPQGVTSAEWFAWVPVAPFTVDSVEVSVGDVLSAGLPLLTATGRNLEFDLAVDRPHGEYVFNSSGLAIEFRRGAGGWDLLPGSLVERFLDVAGGDAVTVSGTLEQTDGPEVFETAGTALSVGPPGSDLRCVWISDPESGWFAVAVDVVAQAVTGTIQLRGDLPDGALVLLNPAGALGDDRCPSN